MFNDVIVLRVEVSKSREISLSTWDHTSQLSWHGPVRWEVGVDQSAFEHNKHDVFAFFVSCNQLLQHEYYVFSTSCNKTAYHWCYIHRITTKPVGLKWFDTPTFTCGIDHRHRSSRNCPQMNQCWFNAGPALWSGEMGGRYWPISVKTRYSIKLVGELSILTVIYDWSYRHKNIFMQHH